MRYDAIIIGAGPGGSTTAHYLARAGLSVLLLDKSDFPRDKTCGDGLSPRALQVLDEMGVLETIRPHSRQMDALTIVAPAGQRVEARVPQEDGLPGYGLVVPRLVLDDAIRQRAVASGAVFQEQVHVEAVEDAQGEGVRVRAKRGSHPVQYHGRSAVIATGASLGILKQMGLLNEAPAMMVAARAYFEGIRTLDNSFQFRFDGVPLPGYGWLFPLSDHSANVGAGFFRRPARPGELPPSAKAAFDRFVEHPPMARLLDGARQAGPVKGYPLLVSFTAMQTYGPGTLIVGEAAGLVNPLTGEGIDYAVETGKIAAAHLGRMLAAGDLSPARLAAYDHELRRRFQAQFSLCERIRGTLMRGDRLDWVVRVARWRPNLKMTLIRIGLGLEAPPAELSWRWLLQKI